MKEKKMFDPKELVRYTQTKQSLNIDGETVSYYPLTVQDMYDLQSEASKPDYGMKLLHRMLSRAYEGLTLEDVKKWPLKKVQSFLDVLLREQGFLPKGKDLNVK